jgi:hypothetical protein
MLDDIKYKFPKIILISGFPSSVPWLRTGSMVSIAQKEQKFFNLGDGMPNDPNFYDARKCHMCEENNEIFGKKVIEFLDGAPVKLNIDNFVNPTKDINHYFRKRFP